MLRQSIRTVSVSLAIIFLCNHSMATTMGRKISMWEDVDIQMIDLINDGYSLVNYNYHSDRLGSTESYHLQKGASLFQCSEITIFGDPEKGFLKRFFCLRLVRLHPLE